MKHLQNFKNNQSNNNLDNLLGFRKKLTELLDDSLKVQQILELFPPGVIMPLFYEGDKATLKSGEVVTIKSSSWKNYQYIYYYDTADHSDVYSYEDEFKS